MKFATLALLGAVAVKANEEEEIEEGLEELGEVVEAIGNAFE